MKKHKGTKVYSECGKFVGYVYGENEDNDDND
jgi:hypothetical protein